MASSFASGTWTAVSSPARCLFGSAQGLRQPRQLARIAPVGLHLVARTRRDERRRDHDALDLELRQPPRQHEARRPRFVTHPQLEAGMRRALRPALRRFFEFREDFLQRVQVVGNAAVAGGIPAPGLSRGDGDGFGVDIESDESYWFFSGCACCVLV